MMISCLSGPEASAIWNISDVWMSSRPGSWARAGGAYERLPEPLTQSDASTLLS